MHTDNGADRAGISSAVEVGGEMARGHKGPAKDPRSVAGTRGLNAQARSAELAEVPISRVEEWSGDPDLAPLPEEDPDEFLGPTSEELGWTVPDAVEAEARRTRAVRKFVEVEQEVELMKMLHRGVEMEDIAQKLGLTLGQVHAVYKKAIRRAVRNAGANEERDRQLLLTAGMLNRVAEDYLFPEADEDGETRPISLKGIDSAIKIMKRRAELTGSDQPSRQVIQQHITHEGLEQVERVVEFMDLADAILESGYGSGRAPEYDDALEVEAHDPRVLDPAPVSPGPWDVEEEKDPGNDMARIHLLANDCVQPRGDDEEE